MKIIVKVTAIAFALSVLSGCASLFDGGSNAPKPTPLKEYKPAYQVNNKWQNRYGSGSSNFKLLPAYSKKRLYTADYKGQVFSIDAMTGKINWQRDTKTEISAGPAVGQTLVVVASANGIVTALNKNTGKTRWKQTVADEVLGAPDVAKGSVLVKTINGMVYAFNAKTGVKLWQYQESSPSLILRGSSVPQVEDNKVFVGFADGKLLALNLTNGRPLWQQVIAQPTGSTAVQQLVDVDVTPVNQDGSVYVASYQGNIASINANTGQIFWRHKLSSYTGLATGRSRVFVTDANSNVWAFDSLSGGVDWRLKQLANRNLTAPTVMGKTIVVGDAEGYLHWINKTNGQLVARTRVNSSALVAKPIVVGKMVYALSTNGTLSAYQLG